jgi:hypothetical protein
MTQALDHSPRTAADRGPLAIQDAPGALPRDTSRFRKLSPSKPIIVKDDPDQGFAYVSSLEMIAEAEATGA